MIKKLNKMQLLFVGIIGLLSAGFTAFNSFEGWQKTRGESIFQECDFALRVLNEEVLTIEGQYEAQLAKNKVVESSLNNCLVKKDDCDFDLESCNEAVQEFRLEGCFEAESEDYVRISADKLFRREQHENMVNLCEHVKTVKQSYINKLKKSISRSKSENKISELEVCKEEFNRCRVERRHCNLEIRNMCKHEKFDNWYPDYNDIK